MAHVRQSRPGSGLGFQVKGLNTFQLVLASLGSGSDMGHVTAALSKVDEFVLDARDVNLRIVC